jgi:hypothetical protein
MAKLDRLRKQMRRRLRTAETLRVGGVLTDEEYAAIAVDAVIRLQHPEFNARGNAHLRRFRIRATDFYFVADEAIHGLGLEWAETDDKKSDELGSYVTAPMELQDSVFSGRTTIEQRSRGLEWGAREDEILRGALFRLSTTNRAIESLEAWLQERWTRFPRVRPSLREGSSPLAALWSYGLQVTSTTPAPRYPRQRTTGAHRKSEPPLGWCDRRGLVAIERTYH